MVAGVDLNHRPLGYEAGDGRNYKTRVALKVIVINGKERLLDK